MTINPPLRQSFGPCSRGYTLIEILVVAEVIAILVALLFAVLGPVRERGREAVCISQLHQWGVALAMYQQDCDAVAPSKGKLMKPSQCGLMPLLTVMPFVRQYHLDKITHCPSEHYPAGMPSNMIPKGISYPIEFVFVNDDPQDFPSMLLAQYGTDYPLTWCDMHNANVDFASQPISAKKRVLVLRYDQRVQTEIVSAHAGPQGL